LLSRGFTQQTVVNLLTASLVIAPIGTLLGGYLVDRIQTAKIVAPFVIAIAIGLGLQMIVSVTVGGAPLLLLAITLGGLAITALMPMTTYLYTRFFGLKSFTEIFGMHMAILALAMGFAPPLFGMLFERAGSYSIALVVMIVGTVCSALLYLVLGPYRYAIGPGAAPKGSHSSSLEKGVVAAS